MDLTLEYYEVVDKRHGDVVKSVEASDLRTAASVIDADKEFERRWRRDFIIRPAKPNAMVIDHKLGMGMEYIPESAVPEDARQVRYNGDLLWYIIRNRDKGTEGRLEAYKRPEKIDLTPQKVYRATKIKEIIVLWCVLQANKNAKLIVGLLVALIIGMLLIFYLAVKG